MSQSFSGRIAFFGGSFDPPHLGHLAVARAARAALGLDHVLFAPVGAQPLKPNGSTAGFEDRVAMTRLAISGEPAFSISLADGPKPSGGPNYTINTLKELRAELTHESQLYCLMGADSLLSLRHWHRAAEIPFVAPLIVASRPGLPLDDLKAMLPPGLAMEAAGSADVSDSKVEVRYFSLVRRTGEGGVERTPFYVLPGLDVEISASGIREQARAGVGAIERGQGVLPEAVAEYIRAHGLYR